MAAPIQHAEAHRVLDRLQELVLGDPRATTTYGQMAEMLGRDAAREGRFVGQVMSRIDLACFYARLPFVSMVKVLTVEGAVNDASFQGIWAGTRDELVKAARAHTWTTEDFSRIRTQLNSLPDEAVEGLWKRLEETHGMRAVERALQFR